MVKRLYIVLLLIIVLSTPLSIVKISNKKENINNKFGTIIINKINLNAELFPIDSNENTIEKHVTILKDSTYPEKDNSLMIIAAHSGIGPIAYFQDLDTLELND